MVNDSKSTQTHIDAKDGQSNEQVTQGGFFTPTDEELSGVPDSITVADEVGDSLSYKGFRIESIPIRGLRVFFISLAVLLGMLFCWDLYETITALSNLHWAVSGLFVGATIVVFGLGTRVCISLLRGRRDQHAVEHLRQAIRNHLEDGATLSKEQLFGQFNNHFANKPQYRLLTQSLSSLPDYTSTIEAIDHIEHGVVKSLDTEAMRCITKYSLQTGKAVALSPWASLEMLFALWRNVAMINEIAQVYGCRPSLMSRYSQFRKVAYHLAFIGGTEVVIDYLSESTLTTITSIASARITQGIGAGVYTARIGMAAMELSRPIEFTDLNRPKLKSFLSLLVGKLKSQ